MGKLENKKKDKNYFIKLREKVNSLPTQKDIWLNYHDRAEYEKSQAVYI